MGLFIFISIYEDFVFVEFQPKPQKTVVHCGSEQCASTNHKPCLDIMDPASVVGLASAIASLAQPSFAALNSVCEYSLQVREAPAKSAELRNELAIMSGILTNLEIATKNYPDNFEVPSSSINYTLSLITETLQQLIQKLGRKVDPSRTVGLRRVTWPFKSEELKEYIEKLQRFGSFLNLASNSQQMYSIT